MSTGAPASDRVSSNTEGVTAGTRTPKRNSEAPLDLNEGSGHRKETIFQALSEVFGWLLLMTFLDHSDAVASVGDVWKAQGRTQGGRADGVRPPLSPPILA